MRRISPSSQLVLLVVLCALFLSLLAAGMRAPSGIAAASPSEGLASLAAATLPVASPSATSSHALPSAPGHSPTQTANATAGATPPASPASTVLPRPSLTPTAAPTSGAGNLAELLAMVPTAPEQRAGYDRSLFVHWIDADGDGCDTRREVLIAESLTTVTIGASCAISGGSWLSLYDELSFTDPSGLDIDHVVALAEAWDSGAYGWSADRRKRFANDLDVTWSLIAVSASSNRSKSDQDPSDWLPPSSTDLCAYLGDWLAVKVRWSLSVDAGERSAIASELAACPDTWRPVVLAT